MGQQNASYAAAVAKPIDLREAVRQYRGHAAALRRLNKSRPTRNRRATLRAICRHAHAQNEIGLALVLADRHLLLGELVAEAKLVDRINDATPTNTRPELRARLNSTRRWIRHHVQAR